MADLAAAVTLQIQDRAKALSRTASPTAARIESACRQRPGRRAQRAAVGHSPWLLCATQAQRVNIAVRLIFSGECVWVKGGVESEVFPVSVSEKNRRADVCKARAKAIPVTSRPFAAAPDTRTGAHAHARRCIGILLRTRRFQPGM